MNTKGTMIATIKSTSLDTKAPNGSFEATLSVPTLDRDDEIVDADAFDPLPDHITIDLDHAMTVEKTVGSGRPTYDGQLLTFKGTYASTPLAQMTRTLVDEGHIRTMSVAYMNAVYEVDKKDGKKHLRKAELLNAGIVGIPSNRDALITASKSLVGDVLAAAHAEDDATVEAGARHSTKNAALLQSAHDALVQLGVECKHADEAGDEKKISTETNPETKAATAAVAAVTADPPPAAVNVVAMAKARVLAAQADLTLL